MRGILCTGLIAFFAVASSFVVTDRAFAQNEVFSGGDSDSGGGDNEVYSGHDDDDNPNALGSVIGQANCKGISRVWNMGRCNARQITSYTGCGPWYGSYSYFIKTEMQHWGEGCVLQNGNQLFCHQAHPGMCNPSAGGRPDNPLVDSGMRYTKDCQMVCDHSAWKGGTPNNPEGGKTIARTDQPKKPPPVTKEPNDRELTDAISSCFKNLGHDEKTGEPINYYTRPHVARETSPADAPVASYDSKDYGIISYDPAKLDALPLTSRVFTMARAYAQHVEALRYHTYIGGVAQDRDVTHDEDRIIGFVAVCLDNQHILPSRHTTSKAHFKDDWRQLYGEFIGSQDPKNDERVQLFREGSRDWPLAPLSLLPPGTGNPDEQ